jgi:hypothetical protein
MSARTPRAALVAVLAVLLAAPAAQAATITPAVALPGDQLTCAAAAPGGTDVYEWTRDGDVIAGAVAATYTTTLTDRGSDIGCTVDQGGTPDFADPVTVAASAADGALFSGTFSGSVGSAVGAGITVTVELLRRDAVVAQNTVTTDADGDWQANLANAFANGRDGVRIRYAGPDAPEDTLISAETTNVNPYVGYEDGAGDNPADTGGDSAVKVVSFCFACVAFEISENGGTTFQPATLAGFEWSYAGAFDRTSALVARERHVGIPTGSTMPVAITVTRPLPAVGTQEWTPPTCQADLATTVIRCRGASQPGDGSNPYRLRHNGGAPVATTFGFFGNDLEVPGNANHGTFVTAKLPGLQAGDTVQLVTAPGDQVLTTLTVANLRAHIAEDGSVSGTCEPGQFLDIIRNDLSVDGPVCPAGGQMSGADVGLYSYDDRSGGRTEVRVPQITGMQPAPGAVLSSGAVTLKAQARYYADEIPGWLSTTDPVSVTVTREGGGAVASATDVNGAGVPADVGGPGRYAARWKVTDRNGDTRTIVTSFTVAAPTATGGGSPPATTGGGAAPAAGRPGPVAVASIVGRVALQSTRFRAAGKGGPVAGAAAAKQKRKKKKAPIGTLVTYRLTAAGTARFAVERTVTGRRKGRGCVKATKKNRKARSCKRVEVLGTFTHTGVAGLNRFRFTGRVGKKALRPGRYTLAAGVGTAKPDRRTAFRIVR